MSLKLQTVGNAIALWESNTLKGLDYYEEAVRGGQVISSKKEEDIALVKELGSTIRQFRNLLTIDKREFELKLPDFNALHTKIEKLAEVIFSKESYLMRMDEEAHLASRGIFDHLKESVSEVFSGLRMRGSEIPIPPFQKCLQEHSLADPEHKKMGVFSDLQTHFKSKKLKNTGDPTWTWDHKLISDGVKEVMRSNVRLKEEAVGDEYPVTASLTMMVKDCLVVTDPADAK